VYKKLENTTKGEDQIENHSEVTIIDCFDEAAKRLSPLWDIRDYVAVNPFFGLRDKSFLEAIEFVKNVSGKEILPKNEFFLKKYNAGEITETDLDMAIKLFHKEKDQSSALLIDTRKLINFINTPQNKNFELQVKCLSDIYDIENDTKATEFITKEISKWASAYFDEGQATWKITSNDTRFFHWWKSLCKYDRSFGKSNPKFISILNSLPHDPHHALEFLTKKLLDRVNLNHSELTLYFYRLLFTVLGWASYAQKFEFEAVRTGDNSELKKIGGLIDILTIRMAYDLALISQSTDLDLLHQKTIGEQKETEAETETELRYIWLNAAEISYRRKIEKSIQDRNENEQTITRPLAQMAFCIDVRSEIIRRHIELQSKEIQTIGFAGFFGLTISVKGLGNKNSDQQCPVLLNSSVEIPEISSSGDDDLKRKRLNFVKNNYFKRYIQQSANSGFSFVETVGFSYIPKILKSAFGFTRPNIDTNSLGLTKKEIGTLELDTRGLSLEKKLSLAHGALTNMGLTKNFSQHIFFFGHGSESSNNPYASALDCGACAGHNGHSNSRLLASLLNEVAVRDELKLKGIDIPADTVFISGWHNTTKDVLVCDEVKGLSHEQKLALEKIRLHLIEASKGCRQERSKNLAFSNDLKDKELETELNQKSMDWSEIRPEWGLARNASFIVGRRKLTRKVELSGRSFLHDYDEKEDHDLSRLELIMTAPMIVTNWINMQYYASTIDQEKFGAGNKVLNNVVGTIGCIQGNGGDLLGGLTEQSVRYKGDYYHEPLRLQVFIEAHTSSIDKIIEKHQLVRDLVENNWLKLIAVNPDKAQFKLYQSKSWIKMREELLN
jgi:uncharacterized protein YbcC (UPF0753/DUF2309 family)